MIRFRLQLKKLSDGRLVFAIPVGYKILLLFIGLLILIFLFVMRNEGGVSIFVRENTIPLIICLISLLGAAYHESWIFDGDKSLVIQQNGLIVLHSNKLYRIEDMEGIEVSQFMKGRAAMAQTVKRSVAVRPILTLSLLTNDGRSVRLENYRITQRQRVEATAREIAEYCAIPYENHITSSD